MMSTIEAIQYRHLSLQTIAELAWATPRSAPAEIPWLAADRSTGFSGPSKRPRQIQVAEHTYRVVRDDESRPAWELVAPEPIAPALYREQPRGQGRFATIMLLYASLSMA